MKQRVINQLSYQEFNPRIQWLRAWKWERTRKKGKKTKKRNRRMREREKERERKKEEKYWEKINWEKERGKEKEGGRERVKTKQARPEILLQTYTQNLQSHLQSDRKERWKEGGKWKERNTDTACEKLIQTLNSVEREGEREPQ